MRSRKLLCCLLVLAMLPFSLGWTTAAERPAVLREEEKIPLDWFADAAIVGDSVTGVLEDYCGRTGGLGEALFLCPSCYSVHNAISGDVMIWFQGASRPVEDALALSGVSKAFFMLGVNDVARSGGVERTMELWHELLERIRGRCPELQLYIESCLPVYRYADYLPDGNGVIDSYNEQLRQFCQEEGLVFVDIAHLFNDEENALADEFCSDQYVHVTFEAAALWVDLLRDPFRYSVRPLSDAQEGEA